MRRQIVLHVALGVILLASGLPVQAKANEQDQEQLRQLLKETRDAVNSRNVPALTALFAKGFSATMIDQSVVTTPQGMQAYFTKWFGGKQPFIKKLTIDPVADIKTQIYDGKFGIVRGRDSEAYQLSNGNSYTFKTRWTATVIKDNGQWKILTVHNATNFLHNPLLSATERTLYYSAGGAAVLGLIFGFFLGRRRRA